MYLGDFAIGSTIYLLFNTGDGTALVTLSGGAIACYKNGVLAEASVSGLSTDFDSKTGLHLITLDTSLDPAFYAAAADYAFVLSAGTVDGVSEANTVLARFSLQNRYAVSGAPTAAEVAAAVWAYTTRTLTSFASLVTDLVTALSGRTITIAQLILSEDEPIRLVAGDAYDIDHGRQIDAVLVNGPSLAAATVKLVINRVLQVTATTVLNPGTSSQTVRFELTAAQTALLLRVGDRAYHWQVQATWAADATAEPAVLAQGDVTVIARYTSS